MKKLIITVLMFICVLHGSAALASPSLYYQTIYNHVYGYRGQEASVIAEAIVRYSEEYGVDPLLTAALFQQESNFSMGAISPVGAIGISQLMPGTAQALGVNPYDIIQNIEGGTRYFAQQQRRFADKGAWQLSYAVAAYNAGPGAIEEYGHIPPYAETKNHVEQIYRIHEQLKGKYYASVSGHEDKIIVAAQSPPNNGSYDDTQNEPKNNSMVLFYDGE